MHARRSKSKPLAFKLDRPFTFSVADFSNFSFPQWTSTREPTSHIVQCLATNPRPEVSGFSQKGFSQIAKEEVGKAMHAACLKGYTRLCVFHTNTLINMYSKLGNIEYAQQVFDRMLVRNEASYNNMIAGYVKAGLHISAWRLFTEMRNRGFDLNAYNIPSLLTAFSRSGCLFLEGLQIHGLVLKTAMIRDVFVSTSLLHFYGGFQLISDARMLFEGMPIRNVVSWTSLMCSYAEVGLFNEVVNLYRKMRLEGEGCDQNAFRTVISSCPALDDEVLVHQVLGHVVKCGLEKDVSVSNSLICAFDGFGMVKVAASVFDNMDERNTISWNSMLAAFTHSRLLEELVRCFHLMRLIHGEVDENTLLTVLSVCDSVDNLKLGGGIHGLALKTGLGFNMRVSNTLLTMYFKTGRCEDAENLFHNMPEKDLVSWNSMMAGYALQGDCFDVLRVLRGLLCAGNIANFVTFATALSACVGAEFLDKGKSMHALVITSGLHENTVVGNALVTMYGRCGTTIEAEKVFHNMPEIELVGWNALISGYAENKEVGEAIKTFNMMRERRINPDYVTLVHALESCCNPCYLVLLGMPLHAYILLVGFGSDEYVRNALISMYAKCGDLDSSNSLFCSSISWTSTTWNAVVAANARHGRWEEALELLREMQRAGFNFDNFSLSTALSASANLAILEEGQQLHGFTIKLGLDHHNFVVNAAMDMYGKCGELNDLLQLLPNPERRSVYSWNILISAYARHGYFHEAKETFSEMVARGAEPDHLTFAALLSACSHGGLIEDGLAYYASMTSKFGVPVGIKHCVCIVDLLGRSGRLAEAEAFIAEMPVPPDERVWRTLLAVCIIHGHWELGKKAARCLLEANPSDDSAYVLYSNICAASGRWQDVQRLRFEMKTSDVKKQPGRSWHYRNYMCWERTFGTDLS